MNCLLDYISEEAARKNKTMEEWLMATSINASKCTTSYHIGRFSHPSADVKISYEGHNNTPDGYITTDAVSCTKDITVSSAAFLATSKFLMLELEDGKTVLSHFKEDTDKLRQDLSALQIDYTAIRNNILQIKENHIPEATDERIRQVFFPVENDQYHLLSILPASSLMLEVRKRIRAMETAARAARDKKNEHYGTKYKQILGLTEASFGGTKPQNISTLNNMNGGRAYLLPAIPPRLPQIEILPPKHDFFQSLHWRDFSSFFYTLHHFYKIKWNNVDIRQDTRSAEDTIIDRVLMRVFLLRSLEPGWSDKEYCHLPHHQKVWLDNLYDEDRRESDTWIGEVAREFTGWILRAYKSTLKKDAFDLSDTEFNALRHRIHNILLDTEEVRQ